MDIGNPAIADEIVGLRIAYRSGLDVAACELRIRRVAGTYEREKLIAATHTADTLARAYVRIDLPKAAHWRGIADAYARAANVLNVARGPLALGGLDLRELSEARHA